MTVNRAKIEIEYDKKILTGYYFKNRPSVIEIDGQEYDGRINMERVNNTFKIKIQIKSDPISYDNITRYS